MEEVKPTLRQRQAQVTRNLILDAARALFLVQGYGATSIEQIATEAGTGVSTIYAVFGNKRELLAQVRWRAVQAADIPDLESMTPAGSAAPERLALLAARFRKLYESAGDVFVVQRAANDSDREVAANWAQASRDRRAHMERLLKPLARELRVGLTLSRATDVVEAVLGFEVYEVLVNRHAWSPAEYEGWLAWTLGQQLLAEVGRP